MQVAAAGASTMDLKKVFGWKCKNTAMKYVSNNFAQMKKSASLVSGTGGGGAYKHYYE